MFREEQHPATELLLRALDGELSPKEAKGVQRHLQACWKCRAQSDDISRTVNAYTALSARYASPRRLRPPNGWIGFQARLTKLEEERRKEKARDQGRRLPTFLWRQAVFSLPVALLMLCGVLFWARFSRVQTVSASDLLRRAAGSEQAVLREKHARGVFQRVRFKWKQQVLLRSSYRDFARHRRTEKWGAENFPVIAAARRSRMLGSEIAHCEDAMTRAKLNVADPLSAEGFRTWLQHQPYSHRESVFKSEHRFRLVSEIDAGPVQRAELVLRSADYHAVRERFQFAGDEELEITELAYEVRPPTLGDEPERTAAQSAITSPARRPLPARRQIREERAGETEEVEMEARMLLHREGADLGEQIAVERSGETVAVAGIVETSEQKNALSEAFKGIPHVRVQLQTVDEAVAQLPRLYEPPTNISSSPPAGSPLLLDEMKARFSDDQRRSYVSQALALSERSSSHAFALRELAMRYPADAVRTLPANAQHQLAELAREHWNAIGEEQAQLQKLLSPFLEPDDERPRQVAPVPWQSEADLLVKNLQQEHNDLVSMFVAADATPRPLGTLKLELRRSFDLSIQAPMF